jgi:mono/diheme cytochrome c family protein
MLARTISKELRMRRLHLRALILAPFAALLLAGCASASADVQNGERVYLQNCVSCHGGKAGNPPLPSAPPHTNEGHTWHHGDDNLRRIITGELNYPNRTMPAFSGTLSDQDVTDVLAFIKTWWGPEQRKAQERATASERSRR